MVSCNDVHSSDWNMFTNDYRSLTALTISCHDLNHSRVKRFLFASDWRRKNSLENIAGRVKQTARVAIKILSAVGHLFPSGVYSGNCVYICVYVGVYTALRIYRLLVAAGNSLPLEQLWFTALNYIFRHKFSLIYILFRRYLLSCFNYFRTWWWILLRILLNYGLIAVGLCKWKG